MKGSFIRVLVGVLLAVTAGRGWAQEEKPQFKFELHGFVGGSLYFQDSQTNSTGGAATYVTGQPRSDRGIFSADVRQTRFNMSLAGPKVLGDATPKAVVEFDFYGGVQPAGGSTQITALSPRLRLAYGELNWGSTIIRFGQDSDLVMGVTFPNTVGHSGNPLTFNAGSLGNRHPGLFAFYTTPVAEGFKMELALQITRSVWTDAATGAAVGADPRSSLVAPGIPLGLSDSSGLPMVQARAKVKHASFEAWIAGSWNQVDLNGIDDAQATTNGATTREVVAGNMGGWVKAYGFELRGSAFVGKNLAALGGAMGQFAPLATKTDTTGLTTKAGDIHEYGAWAQLGYTLPSLPGLSGWVLAGIDRPNKTEVKDAIGGSATVPANNGRWSNLLTSAMVRYSDGGFQLGLEYTHWYTRYIASPAANTASSTTPVTSYNNAADRKADLAGDQLMLSGVYFF
jgi:hypothetical protein